MNLLRLSIRQTYATTGIDTRPAKTEIQSSPGEQEIQSIAAAMEMQTKQGQLSVDSSRAWMALGKGNHLEWLRMINGQMDQEFLMNVSRIVEEGNRLADFTNPGNSVASIMVDSIQEKSGIQYQGEASAHNVDLNYTPAEVNINWQQHETNIKYTPQRPQVSYEPGSVDVYLKNKNSIQMWVSNYDIYG